MEAPRRIRVNVVSPPCVTEPLEQLKMEGVSGLPEARVARAYALAVTERRLDRSSSPPDRVERWTGTVQTSLA